jgi:SulP family sulfate permease
MQRLISLGVVAIISSGFGILISISFALFIFSGELSPFLGTGIGLVLFSAAVIRCTVALFSKVPGVIADTDALPSAIIATVSTTIAQSMTGTAPPEAMLATLVAFIGLSSLFTGAVLVVLGRLQIGGLIRYIPYPVAGGFIAGTGWLLFQGAFEVMLGHPLTWTNLVSIFYPIALMQWGFALGLALLLLVGSRKFDHPLFLPVGFSLGAALFYIGLFATGTSLNQAAELGLVIGSFPKTVSWPALEWQAFSQVDWAVVFSHSEQFLLLAGISAILILFNASGLEQITDRDIDLDHELRVVGWANALSGLGGGMVGFHVLGDTTLAYQLGARTD